MDHVKIRELEFTVQNDVIKLYDIDYVKIKESFEEEGYEDLIFQSIEINGEEIENEDWDDLDSSFIDSLYEEGIKVVLNDFF